MTPTAATFLGVFGWAVISMGAVLLGLALFKDRSRGRRRCPRCWYDMGGVPGLTCPECGRPAKAERRLFRTRRRWRRAAVAIVVVLAGWGTTAIPELRHGWERLIPTTVLVLISDPLPRSTAAALPVVVGAPAAPTLAPRRGPTTPANLSASERLTNEAWTRIVSGNAWAWQSQHFISRVLREAKVGPDQFASIPAAWPLNEPLHLKLAIPTVLSDRDFSIDARSPGSGWCIPVRTGVPDEGGRRTGPARSGAVEIRLRHRAVTLWTATLHPPLRVRGTIDTFLDRITDADAAVQAALRPRLFRNDRGNWVVEYQERDTSDLWAGIDYGVEFRAEVLVAGRPIGRTVGMVVWGRSDWPGPTESLIVFDEGGREALERATEASETPVVLRITGAPDRAGLSYMNHPFNKPRPACWAGAFDIRVNPADRPPSAG